MNTGSDFHHDSELSHLDLHFLVTKPPPWHEIILAEDLDSVQIIECLEALLPDSSYHSRVICMHRQEPWRPARILRRVQRSHRLGDLEFPYHCRINQTPHALICFCYVQFNFTMLYKINSNIYSGINYVVHAFLRDVKVCFRSYTIMIWGLEKKFYSFLWIL